MAFQVEGLTEDGDPVPEPSSLETVMADRDNRDGVAILVALTIAAVKVVRVNVTIPEDVLDRFDRFAAERGMNRSGFLTHAAKRAMDADKPAA